MRANRCYYWLAGLFLALLAPYACMAATQVLTVNTNGSGTVHRNPTNMVVPQGAVVTLTAIPSTNWMFDFWSGDATGSTNPINVTMDRDKTITANFSPIPSYTLTVMVSGQGTVDPPGGIYPSNTMVSLTATPASGWVFSRWTGSVTGSTNPVTITMNGNKTVTAVFVQPPLIVSHPESVSASSGDNVTFRVTASGTPPLYYTWQFNGSNIPSEVASNLTLTNVQPADSGDYRVIVSNVGGSVTSQVAVLTITNFCAGPNVVAICRESDLREAIARGGIVQFCCAGTITLANEIIVTNNVELRGGEHQVVVSGNRFRIGSNVTFTVSRLWLIDGRGAGAIYNEGGIVRMFSCVISNNAMGDGTFGNTAIGGALFNRHGVLSLEDVLVVSNTATGGNGSVFSGPWIKSGAGLGGAIFNEGGSVFINRSEFKGNIARAGTGQRGSGAAEASGGAIYNTGILHVRDSAFSQNAALGGGGSSQNGSGNGGAVYNSGTAYINNTTFQQNVAQGGHGAAFGGGGYPGADGNGGAIYNANIMSVTNCTVVLNRAQAGDRALAPIGGDTNIYGGVAYGGAIYGRGQLFLMNVTIASNIVAQGVHSPPPQGANLAGTLSLRNSLVAYGVAWTNGSAVSWPNAWGTVFDGGFNISSDGSCDFNSGSSFNFTDPRLGPLADNGGPTLTMRPRPESPAIDFGTADGAPPFDQRGARRPSGSGVDMGAYEVGPIAPILLVQRNASMLNLSFIAEAGVNYQLRYSTNLSAWHLQETIGAATTNRTISRSIPTSGPRRFFRIQ